MTKNNKKISSKQKALILAEVVPGCVISKLAKSHGISKGTIYAWIKRSQNPQINKLNTVNSSIDNSFVEINLINTKNQTNSTLEKASLIFNNFSLCIEGKVASGKLIAIIKILEEQPC
jgi:transposase-like protein